MIGLLLFLPQQSCFQECCRKISAVKSMSKMLIRILAKTQVVVNQNDPLKKKIKSRVVMSWKEVGGGGEEEAGNNKRVRRLREPKQLVG